jgi:hypothetical protein
MSSTLIEMAKWTSFAKYGPEREVKQIFTTLKKRNEERSLLPLIAVVAIIGASSQSLLATSGQQVLVTGDLSYLRYAVETGDLDGGADSYTTKSDSTKIIYNLGISILMSNGLFIGGKLLNIDETLTFSSNQSDSESKTEITTTGYGVTVGYSHQSGFSIAGSYILEPEKETTSSSLNGISANSGGITLGGGSGTIVEAAYYIGQNGNWGLGPAISYMSTSYKEAQVGSTTVKLSETISETLVAPAVSLFMVF